MVDTSAALEVPLGSEGKVGVQDKVRIYRHQLASGPVRGNFIVKPGETATPLIGSHHSEPCWLRNESKWEYKNS